MPAPKRFKSTRGEKQPLSFVIDYEREVPDTSEGAEPGAVKLVEAEAAFTAVAVAPAGALLDFTGSSALSDAHSAGALTEFLSAVLVDEDVERFQALVRDKHALIDITTLGNIAVWLASEYTGGRPTLPS